MSSSECERCRGDMGRSRGEIPGEQLRLRYEAVAVRVELEEDRLVRVRVRVRVTAPRAGESAQQRREARRGARTESG